MSGAFWSSLGHLSNLHLAGSEDTTPRGVLGYCQASWEAPAHPKGPQLLHLASRISLQSLLTALNPLEAWTFGAHIET